MIRALIVDHSDLYRSVLGMLLQATPDIEVVPPVQSGHRALRRLQQTRIDVIIADMLTPHVNGLGLLKMVGGTVPVVLMTNLSLDDPQVILSRDQGAYIVLRKPKDAQSFTEFHESLVRAVRAAASSTARRTAI